MARWPALRPLVLVVKSLLKANGLNDVSTGGLGSFALANLALAHLLEEAKASIRRIAFALNPAHVILLCLMRVQSLRANHVQPMMLAA